jgi:site-specific recombinase XerD
VAQKIRESTLRKYRRVLGKFLKYSEDSGYVLVAQISVDVVDGYRATRSSLKASTSAKELETLRTFFRFCNKRRWHPENPAKDITSPKIPPNEVVPYTREEVAAILAACDQIGQEPYERLRAKAVLLIMRHTGLRISDACMLRKDQLRDGCLALFTKKTGGHVLLPLPRDVQHALDCVPLPAGAEHDTGYFFWAGRSDPQTLITDVSRALKRVFDKSLVKGAHSHRFRHSIATDILAKGETITDVADVLGISEHVARRHYAKWSSERRDRVFRIMAQVQGEDSPTLEKNGTPMVREVFGRPN